MPDISGLYPPPPQPQQGLLSGDPLRLIGALGEMQRIGITAQQAPALGQIPGQELTNLQTSNQTARMQMQADVLQRARAAYGTAFGSRTDPISADEIHNFTANYATQNPVDAQLFPNVINSVAGGILNNPTTGAIDTAGISKRARTALSLALPSTSAAQPVEGPPSPSGARTMQSAASAVQTGGYPITQPVGQGITQEGAATAARNLENTVEDFAAISR